MAEVPAKINSFFFENGNTKKLKRWLWFGAGRGAGSTFALEPSGLRDKGYTFMTKYFGSAMKEVISCQNISPNPNKT